MVALSRQKIEIPLTHDTQLIVYNKSRQKDAIATASEARMQGKSMELICRDMTKTNADYEAYARRNQIDKVIFMEEE